MLKDWALVLPEFHKNFCLPVLLICPNPLGCSPDLKHVDFLSLSSNYKPVQSCFLQAIDKDVK